MRGIVALFIIMALALPAFGGPPPAKVVYPPPEARAPVRAVVLEAENFRSEARALRAAVLEWRARRPSPPRHLPPRR